MSGIIFVIYARVTFVAAAAESRRCRSEWPTAGGVPSLAFLLLDTTEVLHDIALSATFQH